MVYLLECGLLTLARGERILPDISTLNPYGYKDESLETNADGSYSFIPADDLFKKDHDKKKLLRILNTVTDKSLHYLIKRVLSENDAVTWFSAIYEHINSTKYGDKQQSHRPAEQDFKPHHRTENYTKPNPGYTVIFGYDWCPVTVLLQIDWWQNEVK